MLSLILSALCLTSCCERIDAGSEGILVNLYGSDKGLAVVKAEAEKKVVAAQAEAEANKLRTQALTPLILKQQWIEKWDGKLPVYGSLPTLFKGIE